MSADDRFEEIKRLLDSTISEFQSLFQSAGGFENSRVGNGWDTDKLVPDVYYLEPKSIRDLVRTAEGRKRSLFTRRVFSVLRPSEQEVRLSGNPKLKFVPFWRIKGFHECFYFRGNSYKIDVLDDVVAVEVEGKIRDLSGQESGDSQRLVYLTRRLLGRRELPLTKSFRLNDVTELAYMYTEGAFFVDSEGKEDLEAEAFFDRKLALRKISKEELRAHFEEAELAASSISKEDLVRKLHGVMVKPPVAFSKILSNRFQITELAQYLMPVYSFTFEYRGERKDLSVHGYTGQIFK